MRYPLINLNNLLPTLKIYSARDNAFSTLTNHIPEEPNPSRNRPQRRRSLYQEKLAFSNTIFHRISHLGFGLILAAVQAVLYFTLGPMILNKIYPTLIDGWDCSI